MNDVYEEQLVKRRSQLKYAIFKGIGIFIVLLCVLAALFWIRLMLFVAFLVGLGEYYLFQTFEVEYEYLYVNGELDFDAVYGQSRRKRILSVDMSNLEMMAPRNAYQLDSMRRAKFKTYDFTSQEEDRRVYEMFVKTETELAQIFFEPNDKILESIRTISPRKVIMP